MKKILPLGILAVILSFALVTTGCSLKSSQKTTTNQQLTNEQADEVAPVVTTADEIKSIFATKYNRSIDAVSLVINKETEGYARGIVQMVKKDELPGNGGEFLAAKINGQWKIVYEGIGAIPCADLAGYDFPQDMISDCLK